jgi:hypothetical protein
MGDEREMEVNMENSTEASLYGVANFAEPLAKCGCTTQQHNEIIVTMMYGPLVGD